MEDIFHYLAINTINKEYIHQPQNLFYEDCGLGAAACWCCRIHAQVVPERCPAAPSQWCRTAWF